MARRKSKGTIRVYTERGTRWMEHNGDLTDTLWDSPDGSWVAGVFVRGDGRRGEVLVTDLKLSALKFLTGYADFGAVSNEGTVAIVESGSGPYCRLRFLFADGTSAQAGRIKNLHLTHALSFSADQRACRVETPDVPPLMIPLAKLVRRPVRNSIIVQKSRALHGLSKALIAVMAILTFIAILGAVMSSSGK